MTTTRGLKVNVELDMSALITQLRALADRLDAPKVDIQKLTEDEWKTGNYWLNKLRILIDDQPVVRTNEYNLTLEQAKHETLMWFLDHSGRIMAACKP